VTASDLTVIFSTRSDSEARVVRGLLDANGIRAVVTSDVPHSVFPLGEIRLAVHANEAENAREVIESHRAEPVSASNVVSIRQEFVPLERRVRYQFRDRGLLEHALTHRSRAHEDVTGGVVDNESLEFLGDAVLGLVIADVLYREYPALDEGEKSKLKASLVSTLTLAKIAISLDLGGYLILGRGEEKTGGRHKQALLADGCEALIAALYLDGGLEAARAFILQEFRPYLDEASAGDRASGDYKSALQERLQSVGRPVPEYRTVSEVGPDHDKIFEIEVVVSGQSVATAAGRSKKEAEQAAAQLALVQLFSQSR
jgi:ribonuclease-3